MALFMNLKIEQEAYKYMIRILLDSMKKIKNILANTYNKIKFISFLRSFNDRNIKIDI
jgi:hypothetical protein